MNSLGQALPAAGGRAGSPSRRSFNVGNLNRPRSLQLAPIYPPNTGPSASNFERDLSLDIPAEIEQFALRMDWIGQVKHELVIEYSRIFSYLCSLSNRSDCFLLLIPLRIDTELINC